MPRRAGTADAEGIGPAPVDLTTAAPGHAAIAACLRAQAQGASRSTAKTLLGVSPLAVDARPWFREAVCAQEVADVLDRLGPEWVVLHDLPIGAATLSHLVVGPGGVFAIESRRHPGANVWVDRNDLLVSGSRTLHLDDVALAAVLAGERLAAATGRAAEVHPVLVVLDAASMRATEGGDVCVVSPGRLLGALLGSSTRLSVSTQDVMALAAGAPDTWARRQGGALATQDAHAWSQLRRDVAQSRARAGRWLVGALVASALVVAVGVSLLLAEAVRVVVL